MTRTKPRTIAVITGSRAEFGLLLPVMRAIRAHPRLRLKVIAAGAHFLPPARTIREVRAAFPIAAEVRMQKPRKGKGGTRADDAAAVARGIAGFTRAFARLKPDWVLVLGDRIEAFAAASAAAIAGLAVAHIHGGDRAEGIADESMRHAITKLAHLHLAATKQSAERIIRMGERPEHVRVVGSPAIDGLRAVRSMSDRDARELGDPSILVLFHPIGRTDVQEKWSVGERLMGVATYCIERHIRTGAVLTTLALDPNSDPGRDGVMVALRAFSGPEFRGKRFWRVERRSHLPRHTLLRLLARLARKPGGMMYGNSSAALIEAAFLGLPAVNVGPRQAGRERDRNVVDLPQGKTSPWAMRRAAALSGKLKPSRLYGDGRASPRIAAALASLDPRDPRLLRKRNVY